MRAPPRVWPTGLARTSVTSRRLPTPKCLPPRPTHQHIMFVHVPGAAHQCSSRIDPTCDPTQRGARGNASDSRQTGDRNCVRTAGLNRTHHAACARALHGAVCWPPTQVRLRSIVPSCICHGLVHHQDRQWRVGLCCRIYTPPCPSEPLSLSSAPLGLCFRRQRGRRACGCARSLAARAAPS